MDLLWIDEWTLMHGDLWMRSIKCPIEALVLYLELEYKDTYWLASLWAPFPEEGEDARVYKLQKRIVPVNVGDDEEAKFLADKWVIKYYDAIVASYDNLTAIVNAEFSDPTFVPESTVEKINKRRFKPVYEV